MTQVDLDDIKFDKLDFTESEFQSKEFTPPDRLVLHVRNVSVLRMGHSGLERAAVIGQCRLEFVGVTRSKREVHQYRGEMTQNDFYPARQEQDLYEQPPVPGSQTFGMEGIQLNPPAWIDWEVRAQDCKIYPEALNRRPT